MPIIQQLQNITDFWNANQYDLGELNLFSDDTHDVVNQGAIHIPWLYHPGAPTGGAPIYILRAREG